MATASPLKLDPSRTSGLRNSFATEMRRRFNALDREVVGLIEKEDALGLTTNTRWAFESNDQKLRSFRGWLKHRVNQRILSTDTGDLIRPWTADYVYRAYEAGIRRAHADTRPTAAGGPRQADFVRQAVGSVLGRERLELLYTRNFTSLEGVTERMSVAMSKILADGLMAGRNPREIGRELSRSVGLERGRAETLARTELIHTYAEAQLDGYERMGVQGVGVMAEWLTATNPCRLCSALSGEVFTIQEARGLIPRHANCRCCWRPFLSEFESSPGTAPELRRAIQRSIRAERPNVSAREARRRTSWQGADKRISGKRAP